MIDVAKFLGANETIAREEMLKVLQFEMKLANITSQSSDIRQKASSNPIPLSHLKAGGVYPNSWSQFLEELYGNNFELQENEPLIIYDMSYINELEEVLKETDNGTLANYFAWRVAESTIEFLGDKARGIRLKFQKAANGVTKQHPR